MVWSASEDIGWTMIVALVLVVIVMFAFLALLVIRFPLFGSGQPSYTVDFVRLDSRPFNVFQAITHMQAGDRNTLEMLLETAVAGGVPNAAANNMALELKNYIDSFGFTFYSVDVSVEGEEVFTVDSSPQSCGPEKGGFCSYPFTDCSVGQVEIGDPDDSCVSGRVCCKEDFDAYRREGSRFGGHGDRFEIIPCGPDDRGICSVLCGPGRIRDESSDKCTETSDINDGQTLRCCVPISELDETDFLSRASFPLAYQDKTGTLEIAVG